MRERALIQAAKIAGSQVKLAKDLDIGVTTLNNWINLGIAVPLEHAMHIEIKVNGQVIAENLTPDIAPILKSYKKFLKTQWWKEVVEVVEKINVECLKNKVLVKTEKKFNLPLRLVFFGLLLCCDADKRFGWNPKQLKLNILPDNNDIDDDDFEALLNALFSAGIITKYEAGGKYYGCFSCMQKF